jgi:hypothetical protein
MKKTGSKKSRDTVPLSCVYSVCHSFSFQKSRDWEVFFPTRKNDLNKAGDTHSQVNKIIYSEKYSAEITEGCLSLLALGGCKEKDKQKLREIQGPSHYPPEFRFMVLLHYGGFFNSCTPKRCLHILVYFQKNAL